ncbi:hypothetical protein CEXT_790511, partial [Caerostris extrusa]
MSLIHQKSVRLLAGFFKNSAGGVSETNEPPMAEKSSRDFSRRRLFCRCKGFTELFSFSSIQGLKLLVEGTICLHLGGSCL